MLSTYFSLCWLPHRLQVLHIIKNKRHEWWLLLGMQPCCSVGTDGYRGGHAPLTESMAVLGVPSLTKKAFMTIEKRIGWLFLKSQCNKLVPKKKPLLFPMKGTTRECQQSQSLLMGAGVNAPINTLIMQSLGWA